MANRTRGIGLILCLVCLAGVSPLRAKSQNATVTGLVYDQAGDPVAGAAATLFSESTGFKQQQMTEGDGSFTFNNVPASDDYILQVSKTGFETFVRPTLIEVSVAETKMVLPPVTLTPVALPGPPPKVSPQAAVPPISSQPAPAPSPVVKVVPPPPRNPVASLPASITRPRRIGSISAEIIGNTLGGVIDGKAARTLPLIGRDFLDLALLVGGTYPVEQGSVLEGASLIVNGARANMNNFLLDGADDNDYTLNQSLPFQIVEALQEFRVQSSTSTAEFGRSGGAQVNTISRRGINAVHGSLFEFHRNSVLSADNFFSAYSGGGFDQYVRDIRLGALGDPLSDPTLAALYGRRKPQVVQNQFGGNLGGALRKDKVFGFFNWESSRISNPRPLFERVPEVLIRSNSTCGPLSTTGTCDPVALAAYNLYPAPNVPVSTAGFTSPQSGQFVPYTDPFNGPAFFIGESANHSRTDNLLGRIDWRKGERVSMNLKHNLQRIEQLQGGTLPRTPAYPGNGTEVIGLNQNFSYNLVLQATPRASNELQLGWNRFRLSALALDRSLDPATLGLQDLNFHHVGLPTFLIGGAFTRPSSPPDTELGSSTIVPSERADNVWSGADNISYSRGRHNLKSGGEFRYVRLYVRNEALGRGLLGFFSAPATAEGSKPPSPQLPGQADLATIARVSSDFGGGFDREFLTESGASFIQDQWRARPSLSLNYGIRYEMNTAPVEARDRLVNYYPALGGLVRGGSTTIFDAFGNTLGTASTPAPRAGFKTRLNDWSPRFGFAWSPRRDRKGVVRGAFALMYDQQSLEPSVNMLLNPPYVMQTFSFFPSFLLADTFGVTTSNSTWFTIPYSITARDPRTRSAYVQQFNFGIQQQINDHALFEVAYIGSAGRRLPRLRNVSACTPDIFINTPLACFDVVGNSLTNLNLFPNIVNQENSGNSGFNSLLVRFDTRGFHGFQVGAHYQYSRSIDGASSLLPQVFILSPPNASVLSSFDGINPEEIAAANNISPALSLRPSLPIISTQPRLPEDSSNLRNERARSDFDVSHRFVFNFIYDMPRVAALRELGKGWQIAGIGTAQTGQPYTVFVDFFGVPLRPNLLHQPGNDNRNPERAIDGATPIDFVATATGAFGINSNISINPSQRALLPGDLGRNTYSGPGLTNLDLSILKSTHLGKAEEKSLQFRAEFFNVLNKANFRQPYSKAALAYNDVSGPDIGSAVFPDPFFGKILQAHAAREIQFAVKLVF